MLGARLLVAMGKNHELWVIAAVCLIVNVAGNLIFMQWFGVAGIALATSISYIASLAMTFFVVHTVLRAAR